MCTWRHSRSRSHAAAPPPRPLRDGAAGRPRPSRVHETRARHGARVHVHACRSNTTAADHESLRYAPWWPSRPLGARLGVARAPAIARPRESERLSSDDDKSHMCMLPESQAPQQCYIHAFTNLTRCTRRHKVECARAASARRPERLATSRSGRGSAKHLLLGMCNPLLHLLGGDDLLRERRERCARGEGCARGQGERLQGERGEQWGPG